MSNICDSLYKILSSRSNRIKNLSLGYFIVCPNIGEIHLITKSELRNEKICWFAYLVIRYCMANCINMQLFSNCRHVIIDIMFFIGICKKAHQLRICSFGFHYTPLISSRPLIFTAYKMVSLYLIPNF